MPTPHEGESEKEFISRCMAYPDMQKHEPKQRAAICYSLWRNESMHPDFQRIINLFLKRYPIGEALSKFSKFITNNSLNPSKAYNPEVQFKESFEWIEPLIQPYKQDTEAKYYLVTALTADISLNNVDYGPEDRLAREDSSMNWRPININHDHTRWLPYPRTRVDFSAANEFSLEATLRVDNEDAWLQKMLDNGEIAHPSIEGRPHPISGRYHFTGLALLEKGVQLPGSPLTEIVPLVFNESVGKSICEFKGGKMVCECETKTTEVKESMKKELEEAEYEPLESGDLPEAGKKILANAYASCRESNPDYSKERCSKIAWGAVHNAGYSQNSDGHWVKEMKEQEVPDATNAPSATPKQDTAECPPNMHMEDGKCVPDVKEECEAGWHFDDALQKCVPDNPQVNENALRTAKAELKVIDLQEKYEDAMENIDNLNRKVTKVNAELKIERENHIGTKCTLEGRISELDKSLKAETKRADNAYDGQMKEAQAKIGLMKDNDALRKDNEEKTVTIEKQKSHIDNLTRQHTETFAENTRLSGELTDALNREIQWNKDKQNLQEGLTKALKHQKYVYEFLKSKGFEIVNTTTA